MINIQIFFDGLFLDEEITYPRLLTFAEDNEASMTNNNPGNIYDDNIAATKAARLNLEAMITGKTGAKGTRKGGTEAKNINRTNAEIYIGNNIGMVRSKFGGKHDPRFIATFPQLMNAFYPVTDKVFLENLEALIVKAHLYTSVLGPDFETDLTALKNHLSLSASDHENQNTEVRTAIVTTQMAADVLSDQLTDNVLLIARNNRRSQTAAALYFNTSLLYAKKRKEFYRRNILANSEADICKITYEPDKIVEFINKGASILTLGMKLAGDRVGQRFQLQPGQKITKRFSDFFTNGDFFYVHNDGEMKGMFRLEIKLP
jgi:hypothetical protein